MPNIIQSTINITQAFANTVPLDHSTTISFQSLTGSNGEFGSIDPTVAGTYVTSLNIPSNGTEVVCVVRLRPNTALMTTLTAGSFTFTLTFDNGSVLSETVSFTLGQLQAQGGYSDTGFRIGMPLPPSTVTGGKIYLLRPVAFSDDSVSIGDIDTLASNPSAPLCIVIGNRSFANNGASQSIVLGPDSRATNGSTQSIVIGDTAFSDNGSNYAVIIGPSASASGGSPYAIALGYYAHIDATPYSIASGWFSHIANSSTNGIALGEHAEVDSSANGIAIGSGAFVRFSSTSAIALGAGANVTSGSTYGIAIGSSATVGPQGGFGSTAIGDQSHVLQSDGLAIGYKAQTSTSDTVVIGYQATIPTGSPFTVVIGSGASIVGDSFNSGIYSIVIGDGALCDASSGGAPRNVVLGPSAKALSGTDTSVIIGYNAQATTANVRSIIIGSFSAPTASYCISIGYADRYVPTPLTRSDGSVVFNTANVAPLSTIDNASLEAYNFGHQNVVTTSPEALVIGQNNTATGTSLTTIIGQLSSVDSVAFSLAVGYGNTITDPFSDPSVVDHAHVVVGSSNLLGYGTDGSSIFGIGNTVGGKGNIVVGNNNYIINDNIYVLGCNNDSLAGPMNSILLIGHHINATNDYSANSITIGVGAHSHSGVFTIGDSDYLPGGGSAIHALTVKGNNGGPLDTMVATDSPAAAGQVGLNLVLNTGASFVNKNVLGDVAPPAGSLLLYVI